MIIFKRYPHIQDLIIHYANTLNEKSILEMMRAGISNTSDAENFLRFIWQMAGQMAIDNKNNVIVLGATDNTDLMTDLEYEVSLYFSNSGYEQYGKSLLMKIRP